MFNKKSILLLFTSFFHADIIPSIIIKGDGDAPKGATFSFPVQQNVFGIFGTFYIGAHTQPITGKEFALSRLASSSRAFEPLTPEKTGVNGVADQDNPLFGAQINALSLFKPAGGAEVPVVVTSDKPASVFLIENISSNNSMVIETPPLTDAQGQTSAGIAAVTTDITGHVFAAVQPKNGTFGELNSGIALLTRGTMNSEGIFAQVDATTGLITAFPKALELDITTPAVKLGDTDLASINQNVTLWWDNTIQRLFIGLQTTGSDGSNNGARAVVVAHFTETGGITFNTIAPEEVFTSNNNTAIVGARGTDAHINIYGLITLYTSTALDYLIVIGGSTNVQDSVYALPLVNNGEATGTIANKNALPVDTFLQEDVPKLAMRNLSQPALTPDDMTHTTDMAALVGAGKLLAGPINKLVVRDDTVFALVGTSDIENATGIYSSQALFDVYGKIKAWTQWQRAAGTTDQVFFGALDAFSGTFIMASGDTDDSVQTIKRTTWSNGNPQGLLLVTTLINTLFTVENGGVQSMRTFLPSTPGLDNISLITYGGVGQLALVQTGTNNSGILIPTPADEFETIPTFTNGEITENVHAKMVVISGGALDQIGPITATEIGVVQNDTAWLFVGGSNGLAVLSDKMGGGWNITENQLGTNLTGLTAGMSFKIIGNYSFVKKLLFDAPFLYIITNDTIDRVDLSLSDFASGTIEDPVTIATKQSLINVTNTGSILDATISQACGIVATTAGLVRIGDDKDIRTIRSESDADWTTIAIPENAGAPTALLTVTTTGQEQDLTRNQGGQFYVLTSNAGGNQSRINRFVVNPLTDDMPMQSDTIQPFNDLFVENIPSFFLNFGRFTSTFATDGALYFAAQNKSRGQEPHTFLTPGLPMPQVGTRNVGERSTTVNITYNNGTEINGLQRSQASGSWIIAGDFGMQVLE